jgi:putative intracellular protease/amidase
MNPSRFGRFLVAVALALSAGLAQAGHVLVVLSDSDRLDLKDGKVYPTGFYLNELMQPVKLLLDAGHQVSFATPLGRAPSVDLNSVDAMHFGGDAAALREHQALMERLALTSPGKSPVISLERAEQIGFARYDAVYVPGGHAPMQDLLHSAALGRLLARFHQEGKPTALVCHGPIALLSALREPQAFTRQLEKGGRAQKPQWIYAGYRMTVISNQEEELAQGYLKGGTMKFYPQTALQQAGGDYRSNAAPWSANMVIDRELITGQNPASALDVGRALLQRLK